MLLQGGRSESMTSVYSAAGGGRYGAVDVTGEVNFGLSYDLKQGMLNVQVKECKNLAAVDEKRNRSDPYVKVGHQLRRTASRGNMTRLLSFGLWGLKKKKWSRCPSQVPCQTSFFLAGLFITRSK